jgi:hypothetical protein
VGFVHQGVGVLVICLARVLISSCDLPLRLLLNEVGLVLVDF